MRRDKAMKNLKSLIVILIFSVSVFAQAEVLTNSKVVEMSKAGLAREVILKKIEKSGGSFDASADALIELKTSGVADEVISAIIEKAATSESYKSNSNTAVTDKNAVAAQTTSAQTSAVKKIQTPKEALLSARTISFEKSSINPSRQALEKELLKRKDWQSLNLTIERYKDNADLYVEIGFVTLSLLTHRYVYRVYDRRSGAVLAAGETTSWGSLAENLARHISKNLNSIASKA
jgi:hypothetical protein